MLKPKYRVPLGLILCVASIILLHRDMVLLGIPAFALGFLLMNGGKLPWAVKKRRK